MHSSAANRQSSFRSLTCLGSFESGGSCSSRSPAGFSTPKNFTGSLNADLSHSFSPNGSPIDGKTQLPAGVAVTVLQPVGPEWEGRKLIGTLTDQADQTVKISSWPARANFRIHHGTVLTLRITRAAPDHGRVLFSSPSDAPESGSLTAGIKVPVGILMARGGSKQCWCALDADLGATSACSSAYETFEMLRKRAICEMCPKAFISLRALRADELAAKATSPFLSTSADAISPRPSVTSPRPLSPYALSPRQLTPLSDTFASSRRLEHQDVESMLHSIRTSSLRDFPHDTRESIELRGESQHLKVVNIPSDVSGHGNGIVEVSDGGSAWLAERQRLLDEIRRLEDSVIGHQKRAAGFELQAQQSAEAVAAAAQATRGYRSDMQASDERLVATERERIEAVARAEALGRELEMTRSNEEAAVTLARTEARSEAIGSELETARSNEEAAVTAALTEARSEAVVAREATLRVAALESKASALLEASTESVDAESRLQGYSEEVHALKEALHQQEGELEAANARQGDADVIAEELKKTEELLCTAESRLGSQAIPEAQSLLDALLEQEQQHERACRELSEIREQQASDALKREEMEKCRGQLLSNIECRVQTLQEEMDKEREHFSYHDGHGTALEAQFEELKGYTELRDKELAASRAELGKARYELEEQKECISPQVEALRAELGTLELHLGQERELVESSKEQFQSLQLELRDMREEGNAERNGSLGSLDGRPSARPALRQSSTLAGELSDLRRRDPGRTVCFQETLERPAIDSPSSIRGDDANRPTLSNEALESPSKPVSPPRIMITDLSQGPTSQPTPIAALKNEVEETVEVAEEVLAVVQVQIDRSRDQNSPLGIDLHSETLEVTAIGDGLLNEWNIANPTKAVEIGDCILDMNGAKTAKDIIATIQDGRRSLNISVQKKAALRDSGSSRNKPQVEPTTRQKLRVDSSSASKLSRPQRISNPGSNPPNASKDRLHRGEPTTQRRRTSGNGLATSPQKPGILDSPGSSVSDRLSNGPSPLKDSRIPSSRKAIPKSVGTPEKRQNAGFMNSLRS